MKLKLALRSAWIAGGTMAVLGRGCAGAAADGRKVIVVVGRAREIVDG